MKLGPAPEEMPFDRAVWAQWRCYWPFGGGMFTDLFVHQTTHLISAMGVRYPGRVVGGGGLYLEYDGRDVPDVATVVADYDEGCQVIISATMCNDTQLGEVIRGRLATIKFTGGGDYMKGFEVYGQNIAGGPAKPKEGDDKPIHTHMSDKKGNATYALWENFLACVRDRKRETLSTPELGAAAFTTVAMGVAELPARQGAVLGQGQPQGRRGRRLVGGQSGSAEQEARQAQRDHRLEGRQLRQLPDAAGLPEAGRPVGRRQRPRRRGGFLQDQRVRSHTWAEAKPQTVSCLPLAA